MKRSPGPESPFSRAALPERCSDLIEAYEIRSATQEERSKFLLRTAALLHDILDVDIKSYFDSIPHDRLMALVRERIADGRVLGLIKGFLKLGGAAQTNVPLLPLSGLPI